MFSQHVPELYKNVCQCYYLEKDYPGYIIMCTNTGLLLKFTENRITKRCSIKCCNAESITPFTTYNPLHKYFIIKAADLLLIISEQAQFKVVQEYQQVKDFSVGDFTGCGSPTVRIFTQNSDTPQILTDLIKKSIEPPIVGDMVSAILRDKFQEINVKVKNAEIKLAEKRQLRMRSSRILEDIITKKSWLASQDGCQRSKTHVVGTIPVNLSDEWDRVHGSKWILGLSIKNTSNTAIGADKIISIQRGHSAIQVRTSGHQVLVLEGNRRAQGTKFESVEVSVEPLVRGSLPSQFFHKLLRQSPYNFF